MDLSSDQIIGLFSVLLVFFYGMYNKRVNKLELSLEEIKTTTMEIRLETKNNHGSSLKDQMDRIEKTTQETQKQVSGVSRSLAKLEGKFEQHIQESDC
jgi:hypothetical protein